MGTIRTVYTARSTHTAYVTYKYGGYVMVGARFGVQRMLMQSNIYLKCASEFIFLFESNVQN